MPIIPTLGPHTTQIFGAGNTQDWASSILQHVSHNAVSVTYLGADGYLTRFEGFFTYSGNTIVSGYVDHIVRGPLDVSSEVIEETPDFTMQFTISNVSVLELQSALQVLFAENSTHIGGLGNNIINTSAGADLAAGEAGADTISGGSGNDTLYGGTGNDSLDGGADNDNLVGNQDNDTINAGAGDDYAHGGQGNDLLLGEDGNDRLDGGAGADTINGGAGFDIMIANQDNDIVIGGADGDYMHGGQGNDTLQGGDGDDVMLGGVGSDSIDGGAGYDGAAWTGLRSAYTVTNNGGGNWTVMQIATGDIDTVTGVEFLVFDDQILS